MQSSWKEGKLSDESDMGCVCFVLSFCINRTFFVVNVALDLLNCTWIKRWWNKHWAHIHSCQNFSNRAWLGYVNLAQLNEPQGCCFKWVDANLRDVSPSPTDPLITLAEDKANQESQRPFLSVADGVAHLETEQLGGSRKTLTSLLLWMTLGKFTPSLKECILSSFWMNNGGIGALGNGRALSLIQKTVRTSLNSFSKFLSDLPPSSL